VPRPRQGADGGGLIHNQQQGPVLREAVDDRPQFRLVLGQGLVEQFLAIPVQGHRVVVGFADVDADEHINGFVVLDHA
jgi:hypothetical protein